MKRMFVVMSIAIMMLILAACNGTTDTNADDKHVVQQPVQNESNEQPADNLDISGEDMLDSSEEEIEEIFTPDCLPGEENTCSKNPDSVLIKQGGWYYYGADSDGDISDTSGHTMYILKMPIDGTVDDVQIVMSAEDMGEKFGVHCAECQKEFTGGDFCKPFAVLGNWVYFTDDVRLSWQHIFRVRTDGGVAEFVLCCEPDDLTANAYIQIRDNMLYYIARESVKVDASTTSDTYSIKKKDLETGEISVVGNVPEEFSVINEEHGYFSFSSYLIGNEIVLCGDITDMFVEDGVICYDREHTLFITANDEVVLKEGFISRDGIDIEYEIKHPQLPGMETEKNVYNFCEVVDGFCYTSPYHGGLFYYSYKDQQVSKINNDAGGNLFWSGDEYLYYTYTTKEKNDYIDGLYRVKLDGTGWEDMSWMTTPAKP